MPLTPPPCSQQPPKIATLTLGAGVFSQDHFGYCHIYLLCVGVVVVILVLQESQIAIHLPECYTDIVLIIAVLVFKI